MHYLVRARFREETAAELSRILRDGTIARQRPDGPEIVASMQRAVFTANGGVEWSEVCYCQPPLQHERTTVYDRFFDALAATPIDGYQTHAGRPFVERLDELAGSSR